MGVLDTYGFLRRRKVRYKEVSFRQFAKDSRRTVAIDVNACFYNWLLNSQESFIVKRFVKWFGGLKNVVLVFDGSRTVQKLQTTLKRANEKSDLSIKVKATAEALARREPGQRIKSHIKRYVNITTTKPNTQSIV